MEREPQSSAKFIRELSDLAEHLAAQNITIQSLHADYSSFGSWEITVVKSHKSFKFIRDGRDNVMTVQSSLAQNHSGLRKWAQEITQGFDRAESNKSLTFIEEYLEQHF